jgi:hypothetical protein
VAGCLTEVRLQGGRWGTPTGGSEISILYLPSPSFLKWHLTAISLDNAFNID